MKIKSILLSVSCLMALPLIQAQAQVIPLVNGDFEANSPTKTAFFDALGVPTGLIPGWTPSGNGTGGWGGLGDSGVEVTGNYPGMHMYLEALDPYVYQTTSYVIQPGDSYTLRFDAAGEWADNGDHSTTASLYYLDGVNQVVFGTVTFAVPQNWAMATYTFSASAPVAADGDLLGIQFKNSAVALPGGPHSWTSLDNVVVSVPEPGMMALFSLGGLALVAFRRRA